MRIGGPEGGGPTGAGGGGPSKRGGMTGNAGGGAITVSYTHLTLPTKRIV